MQPRLKQSDVRKYFEVDDESNKLYGRGSLRGFKQDARVQTVAENQQRFKTVEKQYRIGTAAANMSR